MFKHILAQILVVLLTIFAFQTALCEESEEWPEDVWLEDEGAFEDYEDEEDDLPYEPNVDAWHNAMDIYDMFVNCPLDIDYDQPCADGTMFLVTDERFTSMQDLTDFARFFFSDEIAQSLIDAGMYKEEDGRLYARDVVNYMDENIADIQIVTNAQDERVDYTVTVSYLEPNASGNLFETYYYTRVLFEDEWRFTVFPYIV